MRVVVRTASGREHIIECESDYSFELFKTQIFSCTDIAPEEQHFLLNGKQFGEACNSESSLSELGLADGQRLALLPPSSTIPSKDELIARLFGRGIARLKANLK